MTHENPYWDKYVSTDVVEHHTRIEKMNETDAFKLLAHYFEVICHNGYWPGKYEDDKEKLKNKIDNMEKTEDEVLCYELLFNEEQTIDDMLIALKVWDKLTISINKVCDFNTMVKISKKKSRYKDVLLGNLWLWYRDQARIIKIVVLENHTGIDTDNRTEADKILDHYFQVTNNGGVWFGKYTDDVDTLVKKMDGLKMTDKEKICLEIIKTPWISYLEVLDMWYGCTCGNDCRCNEDDCSSDEDDCSSDEDDCSSDEDDCSSDEDDCSSDENESYYTSCKKCLCDHDAYRNTLSEYSIFDLSPQELIGELYYFK